MSSFDSLPDEASPVTTDKVFTGRGTGSGAERKPTWLAIRTLFKTYFDTVYAAITHAHVISDTTGLQAALDAKQASGSYAASSHTQASSTITDFQEAVEDLVGGSVIAGANVTVTYNDTTGKTTVAATISGGGGGDMVSTNNLSDVANAATARSNLGLGNVNNTSDASKPVSTATQTALDLKAPLASPTFTGTVSGVTKTHVGLSNVDNTADTAKPIGTLTQAALDGKSATSHTHIDPLGFGWRTDDDSVLQAGTPLSRPISKACTIVGWRITADVSGSVVFSLKKGTPSGGTFTLASIVASAPPTLSSQKAVNSTTLTGWTTSLAAGDTLEAEITGTPATLTRVSLVVDVQ